jgi:hypothetical protein
MPPLEAKKLLFRMLPIEIMKNAKMNKKVKLMFIDVRKAHLNAICGDEV